MAGTTYKSLFFCFILMVGIAWGEGQQDQARPREEGPGKEKPMSLIEFMQEQRTRQWTGVPRKVFAFYYTWYGNPDFHDRWVHWQGVDPEKQDIRSSTHYPVKGAYDSHDPAIIDYHIELAKSCGIDGFISTWWGQGTFDDQAFGKVLERARDKDFALTIYWETAPGEGQAQIDQAVDDLLYVLRRYASHPAFLKLEDKPVIFVYGRVMGQVPMSAWPEIISRTRREYGKDFVLIADGYREKYARLFDGIHTYNICGWVQGKRPDELRSFSREAFELAVELARRHQKIACITIIPGYDDTKIRTPGINAERWDGQTYRVLWEQAIAADPDWVLITSWNEWHEGSEIEPSVEYGDQYIRLTAEYAPRFKERPPYRGRTTPPGKLDASKVETLRQMYAGKPIGILPDFNGSVVFWLLDAGLDLRELRWEDVLDPQQFNPHRYPVVVYAGHERYVQSVHEVGDVDAALQRYLREGGCLIAVASGPYPFYYNEQGKAVNSAHRLGFPIGAGRSSDSHVRGWETPPSGVNLHFQIDPRLSEALPRSVPFPRSGDPRWRPCTPDLVAEGDIYLPLARLVDDAGNVYGDGIAYVVHQVSEPKNGRNIYVWMGMTRVLDPNELYFAIFTLPFRQ